jgi:hypothetical protein
LPASTSRIAAAATAARIAAAAAATTSGVAAGAFSLDWRQAYEAKKTNHDKERGRDEKAETRRPRERQGCVVRVVLGQVGTSSVVSFAFRKSLPQAADLAGVCGDKNSIQGYIRNVNENECD